MTQRLMQMGLLGAAMMLGCGGELPPDAYGVFQDRNNAAFDAKLNVGSTSVTMFITVTLPRVRSRAPLACTAEVPSGVSRRMSLSLDCDGELVPYKFEYRESSADWVATEEGGTPQVMTRFEGR